jgi:hypothetical protein
MVLRRAAKGIAEAEFRIVSRDQAIKQVKNVGPSVAGLLDTYWAVLPPVAEAAAAAAPAAKGTKRKGVGSDGAAAAGAAKKKPKSTKWVPGLRCLQRVLALGGS